MTSTEALIGRRTMLAMAGGGALLATAGAPQETDQAAATPDVVDTNVSLFQWPFRRLPLDRTETLVARLRTLHVRRAWAGSLETLLHRDLTAANARLAAACQHYPELIPFGGVNLNLPDWERDWVRCVELHEMPGVRLYPNYHGYSLEDSRFLDLLRRAARAGRLVQIAVSMEDPRTQHPLLRAADVDLRPLAAALQSVEGVRVQLINYRPVGGQLKLDKLLGLPNLYLDTARVEATDGVPRLWEHAPGRLMFGSHAPLLIPEAALIRVHESGKLGMAELREIYSATAERLL